MNDNNVQTLYTTEDLLAMPDDDGVDRYLIRGELHEEDETVTKRNVDHSTVTTKIVFTLEQWTKRQSPPRGRVLCGEAACRIRKDPDTTLGMDIMYISPDLAAITPRGAKFVDGVPILDVEITSPSDKHEKVAAKIQDNLDAGVALVWVVDPTFRTVTVYRKDGLPQLFNEEQEISGEPHLPGFVAKVSEFFEL